MTSSGISRGSIARWGFRGRLPTRSARPSRPLALAVGRPSKDLDASVLHRRSPETQRPRTQLPPTRQAAPPTGSLLSPGVTHAERLRRFVVNRQQREIPLPVIPRTRHRHPADVSSPRGTTRARIRPPTSASEAATTWRAVSTPRPDDDPGARVPRRSPHLRQPTNPQRRHTAPQPRRPAVPSLPWLGLVAVNVERQSLPALVIQTRRQGQHKALCRLVR